MLSDVCLSDVWRLSRTSGQRAACAAGRLDSAYWLIGPGSAGLAQGCPCALPLQAWAGHIAAAARLQLVWLKFIIKRRSNTVARVFANDIPRDRYFATLLDPRPVDFKSAQISSTFLRRRDGLCSSTEVEKWAACRTVVGFCRFI